MKDGTVPVFLHHPRLMAALFLVAAPICLYSVSLGHNFLFDEEAIIFYNPLIRKISLLPQLFGSGYFFHDDVQSGDWRQYYRPLTSASFAVNYLFWKLNPLAYNLTNLGIHVAVSILLWRFLAKLLPSETAAFLSALLFTVHPLHTEAVTYIASRGDLLGAFGMLAGLICYGRGWTPAALGLYGLSLFAKESSLLFPLYALLLDVAILRTPPRELAKRAWMFFFVAAAYLFFRKFFCPVPMGPPWVDPGAAALRVLSMGLPILFYLRALLFPEAFKYCDEIAFAGSVWDLKIGATVLFLALFFWVWIRAWKANRVVFFGLGLAAASFLPYTQAISFYPQWAEHYLYIPAIGLTVVLGACFKRRSLAGLALFTAVYSGFFAFYCYRTFQRHTYYIDGEQYHWRLAQSPTPYAHFGYMSLGRLAIDRGLLDTAGVYFKTALAIEPEAEHNLYNIGIYYLRKEKYAEAYQYFKKAYEKGGHIPGALNNAGVALVHLRRFEDAIRVFEIAQRRAPKNVNIYVNLLWAYEMAGRPREGMTWARRGLRILRSSQRDASILTVAMVGAATRRGWNRLAQGRLGWLAKRYPQGGRVARTYLAEHRRELEHPRVI